MTQTFWSPTSINNWRTFFAAGISPEHLEYYHGYLSNIGYNAQYLEYLNHKLNSEELHATVRTQTIKTFVITSMSVVESILFYVLKAHSQLPTTQWQEVRSNIISPAFSHEGVDMRLQTTVQKKLQTPEAKMPTLDQMIKRVERKRLLGIDLETYKLLNHLRKLRNKVHIYDVQDRFGTDWNTFSEKDLLNCKRVLFALLSSELFKNSDVSLLGFIQTSIDQKL